MKKGCLVIVILLVVVFGAGIFFVVKVGKNFVAMAKEMEQLAKNVKQQATQLDNKYPYQQPAEFTLDNDRLQVFITVRQAANETLTQTELYDIFAKGQFGFSDLMQFSDKLISSARQITDSLLNSLDHQAMSYSEYTYINNLLNGILIKEYESGDPSGIIPDSVEDNIGQLKANNNGQQDIFQHAQNAVKGIDQPQYDALLAQITPEFDVLFGQTHMFYFDTYFTMFSSGAMAAN